MEEGPDRVCMLRMGQALLEKVLIDMHVGRDSQRLPIRIYPNDDMVSSIRCTRRVHSMCTEWLW
jgi:hypothetical protein